MSEQRKYLEKMVAEIVEKKIKEDGEIRPAWMGMKGDGELLLVPAASFMRNAETKELLGDILRDLAKRNNVVAAAFVSEAWTIRPEDLPKDISMDNVPLPSEHPKRVECLMIWVEDREDFSMTYREIIRKKKKVSLGSNLFPEWAEDGGGTVQCLYTVFGDERQRRQQKTVVTE